MNRAGGTPMEEETFNLWKELNPVSAYAQGIEECAGRIFIPTPSNVEKALRKIDGISPRNMLEERLLENFRTVLTHIEPHHIPSTSLWSLFYHMVLEGPAGEHLMDLLEGIRDLFDSAEGIPGLKHPPELRVLTQLEAQGVIKILDSLANSNPFLRVAARELSQKVEGFRDRFRMVGVIEGVYEEIYPLLAEQEESLRRDDYGQIIRALYGYPYSPGEIEEKAISWLKNEMKPFSEVLLENASRMGCTADVEEVEAKITRIGGEEVGAFLKELRKVLLKVVRKRLVEVPEVYSTELLQTPEYLKPFIPTAAMVPLGTLTPGPKNIFFYTVAERASLPDVILSLIHEEFGHAVHYTLSAINKYGTNTLLERIDTSFSLPISEGISFHRELEFLELLKEVEGGAGGEEEGALREFFERHYPGGLKIAIPELSYEVHKWRFIRFLRALGDVRINTGKQTVYQFVEWAHRYTSLSRKDIFNQMFIFLETPGYAPSYSIGEEAIVKIQKMGLNGGMDIKEVNTAVASRGFMPIDMFMEWFSESWG